MRNQPPAAEAPKGGPERHETRYRALLEGYPDAAVVAGPDASVVAANAKGASLKTLLAHGQAPEIIEMIRRALGTGSIVVSPVLLKGGAGELPLEVSVIPIVDEQGRAGGELLVLAHDVTMERNLRSTLLDSRQRYKDLVEVSSDFSWEVNADGLFSFVTPGGALDYKPEALIGHRPEEFVINPEEFKPLPFLDKRSVKKTEVWMRRSNGENCCVIISSRPLLAKDGTWLGARGVCRDVTLEREHEAALRSAQERKNLLDAIVRSIRDELDPFNMLTKAATATSQALGASGCRIYRRIDEDNYHIAAEYGKLEGIEGIEDLLLGHLKDEIGAFTSTVGSWCVLADATHYRHEINGAICIWKPCAKEIWDNNYHLLIGDVANQIGIANEQIANHERIINLSRTDSMTGLLNRRAFFEEELPRRFNRLERNTQSAALFYLDLDNFKMVNDIHGHQRGDEAILRLRDMMLEHSRPGDALVRLGGDEFAMWMDGITAEVTLNRANTLIQASKCLLEFSGDPSHPLGVSVGVAIYDPQTKEPLEELIARADGAMYEAKRSGKGGFRIAAPAAGIAEQKA